MTLTEELRRQLEFLREENAKLRTEITQLGRDNHAYALAHEINSRDRDHWMTIATGRKNTHPSAHGCRCDKCSVIAAQRCPDGTEHDWWHGGDRAFCRKCQAEKV